MSNPSKNKIHRNKSRQTENKIKELFCGTDIKVLQAIPIIGFAILVFVYPTFLYLILDEESFQNYDASGVLPYACFVLSLSGIFNILRREFYWTPFRTLEGKSAIFWGAVLAFSSLLAGVLLLIFQ